MKLQFVMMSSYSLSDERLWKG